jgi:hypothetical protein
MDAFHSRDDYNRNRRFADDASGDRITHGGVKASPATSSKNDQINLPLRGLLKQLGGNRAVDMNDLGVQYRTANATECCHQHLLAIPALACRWVLETSTEPFLRFLYTDDQEFTRLACEVSSHLNGSTAGVVIAIKSDEHRAGAGRSSSPKPGNQPLRVFLDACGNHGCASLARRAFTSQGD